MIFEVKNGFYVTSRVKKMNGAVSVRGAVGARSCALGMRSGMHSYALVCARCALGVCAGGMRLLGVRSCALVGSVRSRRFGVLARLVCGRWVAVGRLG